jgi:hypothetical protein
VTYIRQNTYYVSYIQIQIKKKKTLYPSLHRPRRGNAAPVFLVCDHEMAAAFRCTVRYSVLPKFPERRHILFFGIFCNQRLASWRPPSSHPHPWFARFSPRSLYRCEDVTSPRRTESERPSRRNWAYLGR